MSGYFGKVFVTLFLCITGFPALAAYAPNSKVIIIAADEWCPINCDASSKEQGIGIDLARKIFEPQGYRIDYKIMSWTEALKQVREGKVNAVVGASKNDDKTLIFPDNPIREVSDNFYVRTGSTWRYQGVHTLKNKRVGIIEDYGYGDVISNFIEKNKFVADVLHVAKGSTPLKANLDKLIDGKIDVLVESKIVMDYTLKNSPLADKVVWAGATPQDYVYLAFSPALPQSKALAAQYDAAIRAMKKNGTLTQMYGVYGLTP